MRYLHIGTLVRAVTNDVARMWPAVEAEARDDAARDGGPAIVSIRTDARAFGSIPIHPDLPISFTDDGEPTEPNLGVIVAVSADIDRVAADLRAETGPEPERSDEEVREIVSELQAERPDLDWDNLLMGRLAGPASPDRPDVPVWEYESFAERHPDVAFGDLCAARFPVRYFEGGWGVTSVDEQLKPFPAGHRGAPPRRRWVETAHTVIGRYVALYDAGVLEWDPEQRGIVHRKSLGASRAVLRAYASTLRRAV